MLRWLTRHPLSGEQREQWRRDGFTILPGALSMSDVDAVCRMVDEQWHDPNSPFELDMLTGPNAGQSFHVGMAPPGSRDEAHKLNNLFALVPEIRRIALLPAIKRALTTLLDGEPLICNSLNFERGSQQDLHIDSWYMPAPADGRMVAVSFALDRVTATNGPIVYLPGSHHIPAYRFSDGRLNEIAAEAGACRAYLEEEVERRGLSRTELGAEPGDVFIWHGQLLHGGSAIADFTQTRRSLVVHYWRSEDLPAEQVRRDRYGAFLGHTLRGEFAY